MAGCRNTPARISSASARAVPGTGCVVWCRLRFPLILPVCITTLPEKVPIALQTRLRLRVQHRPCIPASYRRLAERICTRNSYTLWLRLRDRCHPDLRGACAQQHSRALSRRRSGGHDVVDKQHLAALHSLCVHHAEGSPQTLTPLMWLHRKQCMRVLDASEGLRVECELPGAAQPAQAAYG